MFNWLKRTAASVATPDTSRTRLFVDSADKALKLRDESGVLISPVRYVGDAISPTQIVANTDNYNPTSLSTCGRLRVSTDASRNLTGITAGTDGQLMLLQNVGAFDLVLKHDVTSTAANRFYGPNAADFTVRGKGSAWLCYDGTLARWLVVAG